MKTEELYSGEMDPGEEPTQPQTVSIPKASLPSLQPGSMLELVDEDGENLNFRVVARDASPGDPGNAPELEI